MRGSGCPAELTRDPDRWVMARIGIPSLLLHLPYCAGITARWALWLGWIGTIGMAITAVCLVVLSPPWGMQ
jgi:hypothetical protein